MFRFEEPNPSPLHTVQTPCVGFNRAISLRHKTYIRPDSFISVRCKIFNRFFFFYPTYCINFSLFVCTYFAPKTEGPGTLVHIPKVIDCLGYQNKNVSTFLPPQAGVVPRREHFPPHAAEIRKYICFITTVYSLFFKSATYCSYSSFLLKLTRTFLQNSFKRQIFL